MRNLIDVMRKILELGSEEKVYKYFKKNGYEGWQCEIFYNLVNAMDYIGDYEGEDYLQVLVEEMNGMRG